MSDFVCPEGARLIPLKGKWGVGKFAIVDAEDFEELSKYGWGSDRLGYPRRAYQLIPRASRHITMHQQIMNPEKGMCVDHINRDKLDNRKQNLRICTRAENSRNCKIRSDNKSGYRGVYQENSSKFQNRPWAVYIMCDSKRVFVGRFASAEEAARAYDSMAAKLHGEFASLNFPSGI